MRDCMIALSGMTGDESASSKGLYTPSIIGRFAGGPVKWAGNTG